MVFADGFNIELSLNHNIDDIIIRTILMNMFNDIKGILDVRTKARNTTEKYSRLISRKWKTITIVTKWKMLRKLNPNTI